MSVEVAVEALLYDATIWDQTSHVTNQAGHEARTLTLGAAQLSWAADTTGLLSTYGQVQDKIATLLDEASQVARGLSVTLDDVGHQYRLHDEQAANQLRGVWDVRQ